MKKATKIELLQFINEKGIATAIGLMNRFNYSRGGADSMLALLKKQGLIINDLRGEWTITDIGKGRLIYYGRL